jgi:hypothetical protein
MTEPGIPLKRARKFFRSRPSYKTLLRWCDRGTFNRRTRVQVRLEFVTEGGRRYVTLEAIEKFKRETGAVRRQMPPVEENGSGEGDARAE